MSSTRYEPPIADNIRQKLPLKSLIPMFIRKRTCKHWCKEMNISEISNNMYAFYTDFILMC